jgi:hypothetical protein
MSRVSEITPQFSSDGGTARSSSSLGLIDQGRLPHGTGKNEYRRINVHRIVLKDWVSALRLPASQRLRIFELLRKLGQRATRRLDAHYEDIGIRSPSISRPRSIPSGVIRFLVVPATVGTHISPRIDKTRSRVQAASLTWMTGYAPP